MKGEKMKTLIIFILLSMSFSSVAFAWTLHPDENKSNYIPGLPKPFQTRPQVVVPRYNPGPWSPSDYRQGHQRGSGHIYVTPDWKTQQRDLRDQRSLMSPKPNPFANDPRNIVPPVITPRGYIFH